MREHATSHRAAKRRNYAEEYMVMVAVRNRFNDEIAETVCAILGRGLDKGEAGVIRQLVDRLLAIDPEKLDIS